MKTKIMGILNVTPDSFYQNSRTFSTEEAIAAALKIVQDGADILDIGGESSRPGAAPVDEKEELRRVIPIIEALIQQHKISIPISIDTVKPAVAAAAIKKGATIINDIRGLTDAQMVKLVADNASNNVSACVMHMQGTPQTMQLNPHYAAGIIPTLQDWFASKIKELCQQGVQPHQIILDPGIGFGKTVADNLQIIHNLVEFKQLGFPLLLGISRKSFLGKLVNKPTEQLLSATIAINSIAIASHVDIIRVHDVKEHRDAVDVIAKYQESS